MPMAREIPSIEMWVCGLNRALGRPLQVVFFAPFPVDADGVR